MKIKNLMFLFALNAACFACAGDEGKKEEVASGSTAKKILTVTIPNEKGKVLSDVEYLAFLSRLPIGASPVSANCSPTSSVDSALSSPSSSASSSAQPSPESVKKSSPSSSTEDESSVRAEQ